jgi:microcystin-dependent protein
MAFSSSTFQRVLDNEFYTNTTAEDQPQTANGSLIANLNFVRSAIQAITNFLTVNNPTFTGLLSGPTATIPSITGNTNFTGTITAPSANLTSISSTTLSATTINSNPNFSGNPTLQNYNLGVRIIGEVKMLMPTTSAYAPPFYLLCDGSSYSTSTYSQLFAAIGYSYGGSAGSGSFNVPSFASRFPIGGNSSISGVSSSNYATGNGQGGYTNTQKITYNYGNGTTNLTPLLKEVPFHSHSTVYNDSVLSTITPVGVQQYLYSGDSSTGVPTNQSGTNIQQTDPVSGGDGVNITPSYISCNFWICYT